MNECKSCINGVKLPRLVFWDCRKKDELFHPTLFVSNVIVDKSGNMNIDRLDKKVREPGCPYYKRDFRKLRRTPLEKMAMRYKNEESGD